jgi:hypothetical protein
LKPVILDPEAEIEVEDALRASPKAEMFRSVATIAENPFQAAKVGRSEEIRQLIVPRPFPYSLIFANEPDRIYVLAFAHHKRRPGYWKYRLRKS